MRKFYCIKNSLGHYWNNDWGWIEMGTKLYPETDYEFSIFTKEEKEDFNLPVDGTWEELK